MVHVDESEPTVDNCFSKVNVGKTYNKSLYRSGMAALPTVGLLQNSKVFWVKYNDELYRSVRVFKFPEVALECLCMDTTEQVQTNSQTSGARE